MRRLPLWPSARPDLVSFVLVIAAVGLVLSAAMTSFTTLPLFSIFCQSDQQRAPLADILQGTIVSTSSTWTKSPGPGRNPGVGKEGEAKES